MAPVVRIAIDDGVAYVAWEGDAARTIRLSGAMRREVRAGRAERPVVGDLVAISADAVVLEILPRRTRLARRAAGRRDATQVIAANVDLAFIATSAGGDVSERRMERYLSVVRQGGVEPLLLLTKADTCADLEAELDRLRQVASGAEVLAVSAATGEGLDALVRRVAPDRTAAIVGSSGVGKSTLVNRLVGGERQRVGALRGDGKGRHTTTRRELVALPTGGYLLDTPGMRELGVLDAEEGLAESFPEVEALAARCRFRDCRHEREPGCAVREALEAGAVAPERVASWRRLLGEVGGQRGRR